MSNFGVAPTYADFFQPILHENPALGMQITNRSDMGINDDDRESTCVTADSVHFTYSSTSNGQGSLPPAEHTSPQEDVWGNLLENAENYLALTTPSMDHWILPDTCEMGYNATDASCSSNAVMFSDDVSHSTIHGVANNPTIDGQCSFIPDQHPPSEHHPPSALRPENVSMNHRTEQNIFRNYSDHNKNTHPSAGGSFHGDDIKHGPAQGVLNRHPAISCTPYPNNHQPASSSSNNHPISDEIPTLLEQSTVNLDSESRTFTCWKCESSFKTKKDLCNHQLIGYDLKKSYDKCVGSFKTNSENNKHKRRPSIMRRIPCEQCGMLFKTEMGLELHMLFHTDEKQISSEHCTKLFKCKKNLTTHMKTHSDEKLNVCKKCSKSFKWRRNLTSHMKIHSDEKLDVCKKCSKSFKWRRNLTKHMQTHSEDNPFVCETYDKAFKVREYLVKHMKIHYKDESFNCHQCNTLFRNKRDLISHILSHPDPNHVRCAHCNKSIKIIWDHQELVMGHSSSITSHCDHCSYLFKAN